MYLPLFCPPLALTKRVTVESECRTVNAWTKTGPEEIMREVPTRLASEGWKGVRPALSATIRSACPLLVYTYVLTRNRAWILRAHFDSGMQRRHDVAVEGDGQ